MNLKTFILSTFLLGYVPLFGMWHKAIKIASTLAAQHAGKITTAIGTGIIVADKNVSDEKRISIIDNPLLKTVTQSSPKWINKCLISPTIKRIARPLIGKIKYAHLDEFIYEDENKTLDRQKLFHFLSSHNIPLSLSQTETDIMSYKNPETKKRAIRGSYPSVINALFETEKQANEKKLAVLYHAMPKAAYTVNYIGTQLESITQNIITNPDFLALRQPIIQEQNFANNDPEIREKFLTRKGFDTQSISQPENTSNDFDRQHDHHWHINRYLASCNYAISGNSAAWQTGESSLQNWKTNGSWMFSFIHYIDPTVLLNRYAIPADLQAKYHHRLLSAIKQFVNTSPTGVLLQIIMPYQLLDETAYPSFPWGLKRNLYKCEGEMCEPLNAPSKLFTELSMNPKKVIFKCNTWQELDSLQFRLIIDKSRLLDFNNKDVTDNFKVKAYSGDMTHIQQFQQEIDLIMKELRKDLADQK